MVVEEAQDLVIHSVVVDPLVVVVALIPLVAVVVALVFKSVIGSSREKIKTFFK
jgi:uncharacterized membrane-anchored protein